MLPIGRSLKAGEPVLRNHFEGQAGQVVSFPLYNSNIYSCYGCKSPNGPGTWSYYGYQPPLTPAPPFTFSGHVGGRLRRSRSRLTAGGASVHRCRCTLRRSGARASSCRPSAPDFDRSMIFVASPEHRGIGGVRATRGLGVVWRRSGCGLGERDAKRKIT